MNEYFDILKAASSLSPRKLDELITYLDSIRVIEKKQKPSSVNSLDTLNIAYKALQNILKEGKTDTQDESAKQKKTEKRIKRREYNSEEKYIGVLYAVKKKLSPSDAKSALNIHITYVSTLRKALRDDGMVSGKGNEIKIELDGEEFLEENQTEYADLFKRIDSYAQVKPKEYEPPATEAENIIEKADADKKLPESIKIPSATSILNTIKDYKTNVEKTDYTRLTDLKHAPDKIISRLKLFDSRAELQRVKIEKISGKEVENILERKVLVSNRKRTNVGDRYLFAMNNIDKIDLDMEGEFLKYGLLDDSDKTKKPTKILDDAKSVLEKFAMQQTESVSERMIAPK